MSKNVILICEGLNGSGKSSATDQVAASLTNHTVLHVREPGGTDFGERVRDLFKSDCGKNIGALSEISLFWAARCELWISKILPFLSAEGDDSRVVIFDRSWPSTYAYNIFARKAGSEMEAIHNANLKALMSLIRKSSSAPDIAIHHLYFDISADNAAPRLKKRTGDDHLIQFHERPFQELVHQGYDLFYAELAERIGVRTTCPPETIHRIHASRNKEEVLEEVTAIFEKILGLTHAMA